jgi:hypothetical protein
MPGALVDYGKLMLIHFLKISWLQTGFGLLLNRKRRTVTAIPMTVEERRLPGRCATEHLRSAPPIKCRAMFGVRLCLITRDVGLPRRAAEALRTAHAALHNQEGEDQAANRIVHRNRVESFKQLFSRQFFLRSKH